MNIVEKVEFSDALKKVLEGHKALPTELFLRCADGYIHLFMDAGGTCVPGVGYVTALDHTVQKRFFLQALVKLAESYLTLYKRPMKPVALVKQAITELVRTSKQDVYGRFPEGTLIIVDNQLENVYVVNIAASLIHPSKTVLGFGRFSSILVNSLKALSPETLTHTELMTHLRSQELFRGTDIRPGILKARLLKVRDTTPVREYAARGPRYTSCAHTLDQGGSDQMGPFVNRLVQVEELSFHESA